MIGETLSHFEIVDEISRGGMGIVYRARDLNLDREVAIKVLPPDLVGTAESKKPQTVDSKFMLTHTLTLRF